MSNVIDFPKINDFKYITGNTEKGEPDIVGVIGEHTKLEYAPNLSDFIIGDRWVNRDELIALILVTGVYNDIAMSIDK